ncbi:MAG: J domain-containing protein [Chloroflexota bacterium]
MRFDVHTIRVYMVNELMATPQVKEVWHDGSDVVILSFKTGESVSIHLVERYMSLDEIQYIFTENARSGHFTMLLLWADMFMPSDGQVYEPDDWMMTLLQLYGGKIYSYDAWRTEPYIFTVHFHPIRNSRKYLIKHGGDVTISEIGTETIETTIPGFTGFWRVARFDGYASRDGEQFWQDTAPRHDGRNPVRYYFNLLGIRASASRDEVKSAYRDLARKHHPDKNPDSDSTRRMQQINDAYQRILRYIDAENAEQ